MESDSPQCAYLALPTVHFQDPSLHGVLPWLPYFMVRAHRPGPEISYAPAHMRPSRIHSTQPRKLTNIPTHAHDQACLSLLFSSSIHLAVALSTSVPSMALDKDMARPSKSSVLFLSHSSLALHPGQRVMSNVCVHFHPVSHVLFTWVKQTLHYFIPLLFTGLYE